MRLATIVLIRLPYSATIVDTTTANIGVDSCQRNKYNNSLFIANFFHIFKING